MCGIIGVSLTDVTMGDVFLVQRIMKETQIRGMHASGVAHHNGVRLLCNTSPRPISELADSLQWDAMTYSRDLKMIAHARYSTSDMEFHQPLGDSTMYMAHNGVITQEPPEKWEDIYDYNFNTRNDSEILLNEIQRRSTPNDVVASLAGSSIAVVTINSNGIVSGYRNSLRPLWITELRNGFIYTSTKDIMVRASHGELTPTKIEVTGNEAELQIRHNQ